MQNEEIVELSEFDHGRAEHLLHGIEHLVSPELINLHLLSMLMNAHSLSAVVIQIEGMQALLRCKLRH